MTKADRVHSTPRRTASKKPNKKALKRLKGLGFIDGSFQMKAAREPDLKRELKKRRQPDDIENLVALYDAYTAASNMIMAITNQPRAEGIEAVLDAEWNYLTAKAWAVAEHLKSLRPTKGNRECFVQTLVDCAFQMGGNVDDAASVLRDAMLVGPGE